MEQSLKNRLTFGPIMLAALFGALWLDHAAQRWTDAMPSPPYPEHGIGGIGLLLILFVILPPATIELATLFAAQHVKPYRLITALGSLAVVTHAFLTQFPFFQPIATSVFAFLVVAGMLLAALRRAWMKQTHGAIHAMAGTCLASLYLGGLSWFVIALRVKNTENFIGTTMVILMILLSVKSTDIGAYFGGRKFGRHKLIPWLSPGKTWEGLFFGLLTAGCVGALCALAIPDQLDWWQGLIFGVIIGGIGQMGDLLESMMKRDADVKDSGKLIPGFGGVLDVIDSPLLAAPFAYLLFSLF